MDEDSTSWATRIGALGMAASAPVVWLWPEVIPRAISLGVFLLCTIVFAVGLASQRSRREGPDIWDGDL